jgi:hypothetical protein
MELIKQMGPDDWHEIVSNWNWDHGVLELEWITSQTECDRATAAFALFGGQPTYYLHNTETRSRHSDPRWDYEGFVYAVAGRLESGFYAKTDFQLGNARGTAKSFQRALDELRASGSSPWRLPADLVSHPGSRAHAPKYSNCDGKLHYHYDYWLKHIAPATA